MGPAVPPDTLPGMQRTPTRRRWALVAVAALALAPVATACSDSDGGSAAATTTTAASGPAPGVDAARQARQEGRTVIDVRTPQEYAEGHVAAATNLDVQAADFDARIAELDPTGSYVVYCRSGNRSAAAAARMTEAGLDVVDGGALTDMAAAGWPTT